MTTREPRVQRFQAHPAPDRSLPPDSAWQDVAAVAFAMAVLLLICFLSSVIPTRELISVMAGPR